MPQTTTTTTGDEEAKYQCKTCDWSGDTMAEANSHAQLHDVLITEN